MATKKRVMAAGVVLCAGLACGGKVELVIPRACMKAVELTDSSECHGPDEDHIRCTGLALKLKAECEQVRVIQ